MVIIGAASAAMLVMYLLFASSSTPSPSLHPGGTLGAAEGPLPAGKVEYSIMFDAGSSGSRIHVFKFLRPTDKPDQVMLLEEMFDQLKPGTHRPLPCFQPPLVLVLASPAAAVLPTPTLKLIASAGSVAGLSAYVEKPTEGADSLKPLLAKAVAFIPKELHSTTPVALRATAGLRMLGPAPAQKILEATHRLFATYNFQLAAQGKSVFIMDGLDEGVYAWVTINYLLGRLGQAPGDTVGVMDLGGGSTQIAFAVDPTKLSATEKAAVAGKLHSYNLGGVPYSVYAHSYLGYGLNSARAAILDSDRARADAAGHPCLPVGFTKEGKDSVGGVKGRGEATPGECQSWIDDFITNTKPEQDLCQEGVPCGFNGVPQPVPEASAAPTSTPHMPFFALSFLYDLADADGFSKEVATMGKKTRESLVADYQTHALKACSLSHAQLEAGKATNKGWAGKWGDDLAMMCLDESYAYALLTKGYHRRTEERLIMATGIEVNGKEVETQWCLGAALGLMGH